MSYNYNPLAPNQSPLIPMMSNLANGAPPPFIPPTASGTLQQQMTLAAAAIAGGNNHLPESVLADYTNHTGLIKKKSLSPARIIAGAGPMDLETVAETLGGDRSSAPTRPLGRQLSRQSHDGCGEINTAHDLTNINGVISAHNLRSLKDSASGTTSNLNSEPVPVQPPPTTAAMMFNGMLGLPQSIMMMPAMMNMIDAATASTLLMQQQQHHHQQYPMLHQQQPPSSVTATTGIAQLPLADGCVTSVAGVEHANTASCTSSSPVGVAGILKEHITCKSCALFPPNPNSPAPTTRERPPGCRTVFVGGLPENVAEEHIREVFERCGEITTLRLSKKNFCHIRFVYESSVDSAIYLSGYRIRLGTITATDAAAQCGRLHVDYAQARDDQYEWECKQRQLQREQRHRERCNVDRARAPSSPPPVVHFTDHEATALADQLKQDDLFAKAVQVLVVWLERGDCSKKNANSFYSMIQSTNSHVRRLQTERNAHEEELHRAREQYRKQMYSMCGQFSQIEKVFGAASHKKVWDHFTKAQRKNIDLWKKQSTEIRSTHLDDFPDNDEMDMSDDEHARPRLAKRAKLDNASLQVENESLRTELAAYRSDADMVKSMLELDTDVKEKQLKVLQETIRNLQTQLLENNAKEKETNGRIAQLEASLKQANVKELLLKTKIVEVSKHSNSSSKGSIGPDSDDSSAADANCLNGSLLDPSPPLHQAVIKTETIDPDEARIIGLVSTFLVIHPFGASLDYVFSYVQRAAPRLRPKQLEEILTRYDMTFSEEVSGVGAKIERKWKFCGFDIEND